MRWEPLLLITLTACLSGLLIIMTGKKSTGLHSLSWATSPALPLSYLRLSPCTEPLYT